MKIKYHTSVSVILMVALTYVVTFLWFKKDGADIVRLGDVFFSLALSFIAASIFYYTVDYFPKKARKKAFLENLEFRVLHIERLYNIILKNLNYTGDHLTIQNVSKKRAFYSLKKHASQSGYKRKYNSQRTYYLRRIISKPSNRHSTRT